MKYKIISILAVISVLIGIFAILPVFADAPYTLTATDGKVSNLNDTTIRDNWYPSSADSVVHVSIKEGRSVDGIYICWYADDSVFTITGYDAEGGVTASYKNGDQYDGYGCFYELPTSTRSIDIAMPARTDTGGKVDQSYGMSYLKLSEVGGDSSSIHRWNAPVDQCDVLFVPTHQDDEYIYMGGLIPTCIEHGYSVAVAYTASCARLRLEAALNGLWEVGVRSYPDFIGLKDKRPANMDEAYSMWGGRDNVILELTRVIRARRPEVVVTHDQKGENNHRSHVVTALMLEEAVKMAADPAYDPESVRQYGTWTVSKLYSHLYSENQIHLNYRVPLSKYSGKTAYEVATDGYAYQTTQHEWYQMDQENIQPGGKYDNSLFGCVYSTVGYDTIDLFYGTSVYNGTPLSSSSLPPETSTPVTSTPIVTTPQTSGGTTTTTPNPPTTPSQTKPSTSNPPITTAPSQPPQTTEPKPVVTTTPSKPIQTTTPNRPTVTTTPGVPIQTTAPNPPVVTTNSGEPVQTTAPSPNQTTVATVDTAPIQSSPTTTGSIPPTTSAPTTSGEISSPVPHPIQQDYTPIIFALTLMIVLMIAIVLIAWFQRRRRFR